MILLGKASGSSSLCCLGNVTGRKCLICPWRTCNICECECMCACERGEEVGGWKGARGVWGRLCTSTFILLYIYSHPVRGCYMITDYIFSSTLKSMIYKRNNGHILLLKSSPSSWGRQHFLCYQPNKKRNINDGYFY